ncbi:hypothetical protein [uncultured Castellaniella sp.]|uniref:hypothetical protein n=1 Tax=uncultured Castellaniella sp. TaxID=647907 RepID=UPI002621A779|nr:hypothetical protein [uncultured Castellaniella sp.]
MNDKATDDKKLDAELDMMAATTMKLQAEAQKILAESRWYPFVVLAGVFGAAIAVVKLMH